MAPIAATIKPAPEGALPWTSLSGLYALQVVNLLLPLASVPYLTRVLGPESWGRVAFAQAFGLILGLFVEFGFNYSATRAVALARDEPERLAAVTGDTLLAQALLLVFTVGTAFSLRTWLPVIGHDPYLFWAAVIWMIPQAASLQWYFQGLERMLWFSAVSVGCRLAGVCGVFAAVQGAEDAARALAVQGAAGLLGVAICWGAAGHAGFRSITLRGVASVLIAGRGLFFYRVGVYLWAVINTIALGFFGGFASLGAYALAERLAKAATGLLDPISQTLLPRLVRGQAGLQVAGTILSSAVGAALGFGLWWLGPVLIEMASGHPWSEASQALRIFALFPVGAALCQSFGIHRLVPDGKDSVLVTVVLAAALAQGGAILWARRELDPGQIHLGLAWAAVGSQFFQVVAFRVLLGRESTR